MSAVPLHNSVAQLVLPRELLEGVIELLIGFLDDIDGGSEDLEPSLAGVTAAWKLSNGSDGEPDLSWGDDYALADQRSLRTGTEGDDRDDLEPSLGVPESLRDQRGWGRGDASDREQAAEVGKLTSRPEPNLPVDLSSPPMVHLVANGSAGIPVHALNGWQPRPVVLEPDARAALIERLEEEFDILGLGILTPDRLQRELTVAGYL